MTRIALAAVAAAILTTSSAAAGGFALSFPNLDFPPAETVTVEKDCIATAMPTSCVIEE